jgi:DnaK suppressor protein
MTIDLEQMKKRLQDQQVRLREHIASLTEARPTPESAERTHQGPYEPEEAVVDLQEMELERFILVNEQALLAEVEEALKRIDEGTYGRCIVGGELIPEKRLEAIPWTSCCVKHEKQVEQSNLSREELS